MDLDFWGYFGVQQDRSRFLRLFWDGSRYRMDLDFGVVLEFAKGRHSFNFFFAVVLEEKTPLHTKYYIKI